MRFVDVIGHAAAIARLRRAAATDRLATAYLLAGPPGVGKRRVADAFAMELLCANPGSDGACGSCAQCVRVAAGTHPDVLVVVRDTDRRDIRTEQARELTRWFGLRPFMARRKVALIDGAETLNEHGQNALLKTLEEPPGRALIVLITARAHLLLPTVRSRCLPVRFAPMPVRALADALQRRGIPAQDALVRAALAGGAAGRALSGDMEALRELRDALLSTLEKAASGPAALADLPALVSAFAPKEDEDAFLERLDLVQALLRDGARAVAGDGAGDALLHADQAVRLRALGARLGRARLATLLPALERLRGDLRFYVNRTLLTEAVLAALAGGPIP